MVIPTIEVGDVLDAQQGEHLVLVLADVHATTQLITAAVCVAAV